MILFRSIGRITLKLLEKIGILSVFIGKVIICMISRPFYFNVFFSELVYIIYSSLPILGITALFTGMVLTVQVYTGLSGLGQESIIPKIVLVSITNQLGPVFSGLMVTSRIGAGIAAHIGSMRVTEQIDAMTTLETDPLRYLVTPRILSCILSMPLLVVVNDILGVGGGYLVAIYQMHFNAQLYIQNTYDFLTIHDITSGIIKSIVFGVIISFMACYHGFYAREGASGVGKAATNTVVSSSSLILVTNYLLTELLNY